MGEERWRRGGELAARLRTGARAVRAGDLVVGHLVVRDQFPAEVVGAFATGDLAVEVLGACGHPDGAGNVQTNSDFVEDLVDDLAPVAVSPVVPRISHRVRMDWGRSSIYV